MNETRKDRIRERTDLVVARDTAISGALGGVAFRNMGEVMEFSKLMAVSGQAVPKHLREEPGACLAVSVQALNWRMDPFAVANKSYAVNDRIAYEAQLIQAVIEQRAPIRGRIKGRFEGEGAQRRCILTVVSDEDGETIEYASPEIGKIKTKNSPLWAADPDQQLWYYSARAMCRRHFPDVLLGVYEKEEMQYGEEIRDVTPPEAQSASERLKSRARPETTPEPEAPVSDDPAASEGAEPEEVEEAEVVDENGEDLSGAFPGSDEWDEGVRAAQSGKPRVDCPYDDGDKRIDWLGGWTEAVKFEEERAG